MGISRPAVRFPKPHLFLLNAGRCCKDFINHYAHRRVLRPRFALILAASFDATQNRTVRRDYEKRAHNQRPPKLRNLWPKPSIVPFCCFFPAVRRMGRGGRGTRARKAQASHRRRRLGRVPGGQRSTVVRIITTTFNSHLAPFCLPPDCVSSAFPRRFFIFAQRLHTICAPRTLYGGAECAAL